MTMKKYIKPSVSEYPIRAIVMDTTSLTLKKEQVDPSNALSKDDETYWGWGIMVEEE